MIFPISYLMILITATASLDLRDVGQSVASLRNVTGLVPGSPGGSRRDNGVDDPSRSSEV